MKLHRLDQNIKCTECSASYPLKDCKRVMNFTTGEIFFYCKNCRAKMGFTDFAKWNSLNRNYLENPSATRQERPAKTGNDRRRRRR